MSDADTEFETYDASRAETAATAPWTKQTPFEEWRDQQGIPVHHDFYFPDITHLETREWDLIGARAAFVDLVGAADSNNAYVMSLDPGVATHRRRQMFEEVIYVAAGSGVTEVEAGGSVVTARWSEGGLFHVPLNRRHRHIATDEGAFLYCVNSAPIVMNLYHNDKFTWDCDFDFDDRFNGGEDFFSGLGRMWSMADSPIRVWETNVVDDTRTLDLPALPERGGNGSNICLELGHGTLAAHISEFPVGYKKAHRHGPGAHVIILSGSGYSLLWEHSFDEHTRCDWKPNSVVVPPDMWWHQHFNPGPEPARYLAIKWGSQRYRLDHSYDRAVPDGNSAGYQIEPEDDDPRVAEMFREACEG